MRSRVRRFLDDRGIVPGRGNRPCFRPETELFFGPDSRITASRSASFAPRSRAQERKLSLTSLHKRAMNTIPPFTSQHLSEVSAVSEPEGRKESPNSSDEVTGTSAPMNIRSTRRFSFKLDGDPRKKGFMQEFLRQGLAQVVFGKKAAYVNCCAPPPDKEQQERDAKTMAAQFRDRYGMTDLDWRDCLPQYPEHPKEAAEVMEMAARMGQQKIRDDKFAVIHVVDEKETTHLCIMFKPLLVDAMEKSPQRFDLPDPPTKEDIREKLDYITDPKNFLDICETKMFSRMLYEDEHSIDMFHQMWGSSEKEKKDKHHPMTEVISNMIASVPKEKKDRTVVPVGMVYFKGDEHTEEKTKQLAEKNIKDTKEINEMLDDAMKKAREKDPDESFSNVAFRETMKRMYYPPMVG